MDFNPEADRLKEARKAAALARLRAARPGAADRMTAAATAEPAPAEIRVEILRRRVPWDRSLRRKSFRPDQEMFDSMVEMAAYFSPAACQRRAWYAYFTLYFSLPPEIREEVQRRTCGYLVAPARRSVWSRLAFWHRHS